MELAKPSQAKAPEISFSVISRPSPPATRAVESPIVSAADTIKIITTEIIALRLNSGRYGSRCGREIRPPSSIPDRSTCPRHNAMMYPTISPASTDSCFKYPFATALKIRHTASVTSPSTRFCTEPKSSV